MSVFKVMVRANFYSGRWGIFLFALAAFLIPLTHMRILGSPVSASDLAAVNEFVFLFPVLAGAAGVFTALGIWSPDFEGGHVYALSLPVTRWQYALLKLSTGATMLLVPIFVFWLSCVFSTSLVEINDPVLKTYPNEVSVRFLFTTMLFYVGAFAIGSGTKEVAAAIIVTLLTGAMVLEFISFLLGWIIPGMPSGIIETIFTVLNTWPGPLSVITGNWMLVDF